MTMKIYVAALAHETNTFSPIPTRLSSFEAGVLYRPKPGEDPPDVLVGYDDMIRIARERGHEVVVGPAAWAQPSGLLARRDYETLRDGILAGLGQAMPVEAVLLMLHGAQMAIGYDDCEGDLLARVRRLVGHDVPIGVELDLHCNITEQMVDTATAIIACKEYPHTDFPDRARELVDIIDRTAKGEIRPVMERFRVPMLSKFHTTYEPMRSFVDKTAALEGRDGVLSVTLAHGFPWGDMPDVGSSVVVVGTDRVRAKALAEEIGREFFALRTDVPGRLRSIDEVLDRAAAHDGLTVIADVADNAGGGAASDSTFLLRAMIGRGMTRAALGMIWDPVAVEIAADAGTGARIPMRIGGKMGPASGTPVDVMATVIAVADDPGQLSLDGRTIDRLGRSAAIDVGGIQVVLNSRRQQVFIPDCFRELGIDVAGLKTVVVKSSQHFHAQFSPFATQILYCDTPGTLNNDFGSLPYRKIRRPIWPIDPVEDPGRP